THSAKAVVTNLKAGTYVFTLTISGKTGWPSSSKVKVVVKNKTITKPPITENSVTNEPVAGSGPAVADAGENQTISLPQNTITLDGTNSTGSIIHWRWDKRSGPKGVKIHNGSTAKAKVSGLKAGTYVFTLTVSRKTGWPSSGKVTVTVASPYGRKSSKKESKEVNTFSKENGSDSISNLSKKPENILTDKLSFKVYPNP